MVTIMLRFHCKLGIRMCIIPCTIAYKRTHSIKTTYTSVHASAYAIAFFTVYTCPLVYYCQSNTWIRGAWTGFYSLSLHPLASFSTRLFHTRCFKSFKLRSVPTALFQTFVTVFHNLDLTWQIHNSWLSQNYLIFLSMTDADVCTLQ